MHVEDHLNELKRLVRSLSSSRRVCQHWVPRYSADDKKGFQDKPSQDKPPNFKQRIDASLAAEDGV